MKISQKQLRHLLSLSKITANIKEFKEFKHDINSVIELFNDIKYIDTKNIEPMISPLIDNFSVQLNNILTKRTTEIFLRILHHNSLQSIL